MGVHPKYLTRLEGGGVNVTLATLVAATVAYKVSLRELFHEEEIKP
jgi:transcriptional regulator with XRE-family HTH domain